MPSKKHKPEEIRQGGGITTPSTHLDQRKKITAVNHLGTVHTTPDAVCVAIGADFANDLLMDRAEALIEEIEVAMKAAIPELTSIYIKPEKRRGR